MICQIASMEPSASATMPWPSLSKDRGIGQLALELRPDYTSHAEARSQLRDRVQQAILSREFPAGRIDVKGDVVVLANLPFSGGEEPIFGVELDGSRGYKLVNYADPESPDYLPY